MIKIVPLNSAEKKGNNHVQTHQTAGHLSASMNSSLTANGSDSVTSLRTFNHLELRILASQVQHREVYHYEGMQRIHFEVVLRRQIIRSAIDLLHSGVRYAVFEDSYCNPQYWDLQENGGFKLRPQTSPAAAIRDIYSNGSLYAFECATAMVIVFYKAVLDAIGEQHFNRLFQGILLWDWHYDQDLTVHTVRTDEFIPGDVLYFANPDVDPQTPEWQGENVVFLEENTYYGHGIGIKRAQEMIAELNMRRKPGATRSAYLMKQATRLDYQTLAQYVPAPMRHAFLQALSDQLPAVLVAQIGSATHIE